MLSKRGVDNGQIVLFWLVHMVGSWQYVWISILFACFFSATPTRYHCGREAHGASTIIRWYGNETTNYWYRQNNTKYFGTKYGTSYNSYLWFDSLISSRYMISKSMWLQGTKYTQVHSQTKKKPTVHVRRTTAKNKTRFMPSKKQGRYKEKYIIIRVIPRVMQHGGAAAKVYL